MKLTFNNQSHHFPIPKTLPTPFILHPKPIHTDIIRFQTINNNVNEILNVLPSNS
jgi:hypothetical protein